MDIKQIINYLEENITDSIPKFIMVKEIYKETLASKNYKNAYAQMKNSKWYKQLAMEQWDNGSWGRFHSQDTKSLTKQKYCTTEEALRRAKEIGLSKDDPMVAKSIKLLERYIRGDETWTDNIEKHHDGGKSHLHSRPFLTAAFLCLFDPENPVVKPKLDIFVKTLKIALSKNYFDEEAWEHENKNYTGPCLNGWNLYPVLILQKINCIPETLQRQYLNYLWHRKEGIYYVSNFPPTAKRKLEDKDFTIWLGILESLSGFSLFPEFMRDDTFPHLLHEIERLINEDINLPKPSPIFGRYSEDWHDIKKRKTDLVLRIIRILEKC